VSAVGRVPWIDDRGLRAQMAPATFGRLEYARYESRPAPCRQPSGSRIPSVVIHGTRPWRGAYDRDPEPERARPLTVRINRRAGGDDRSASSRGACL